MGERRPSRGGKIQGKKSYDLVLMDIEMPLWMNIQLHGKSATGKKRKKKTRNADYCNHSPCISKLLRISKIP
ncbi:MAG: hypothetical protein R2861_10860 [Desulfobacterales bacterium]